MTARDSTEPVPIYDPSAPPSTFEHRGDECGQHGPNVPHFRLKNAGGPFYCVACAQELAQSQTESALQPAAFKNHAAAFIGSMGVTPTRANGYDLTGNGSAQAALDALQPERAAAERTTVELQRDVARLTVECERLTRENAELRGKLKHYGVTIDDQHARLREIARIAKP